jgi:transposase
LLSAANNDSVLARLERRGLAMMGRLKGDQSQLFYSFCLDEVVPPDHRVREIAAVLDLSWVHAELAPYYPSIGRPSLDPVLMIRMLILGYVFAIRSERLLCREVQVNLAYRWFCGLSIEDKIPDHSAFSRARNERFRDSDIFRRLFERVVETCIAAGLVGGEGFAVDASLIVADANKQRSIPGKDWDKKRDPETASRAVKEYLARLDDAAFGAASDVTPKFVSPSDPAAQWTEAMRGPAFFAYADNYLIDVKFGIIMDVEATRAIRQAEVGAAKTMIERTGGALLSMKGREDPDAADCPHALYRRPPPRPQAKLSCSINSNTPIIGNDISGVAKHGVHPPIPSALCMADRQGLGGSM